MVWFTKQEKTQITTSLNNNITTIIIMITVCSYSHIFEEVKKGSKVHTVLYENRNKQFYKTDCFQQTSKDFMKNHMETAIIMRLKPIQKRPGSTGRAFGVKSQHVLRMQSGSKQFCERKPQLIIVISFLVLQSKCCNCFFKLIIPLHTQQ